MKGIQFQIYFKGRAKRCVDGLDRVCGKIKRTPWSQEHQSLGWGLNKGKMELPFTEKGIIGNSIYYEEDLKLVLDTLTLR